jgi:hypothetical protein
LLGISGLPYPVVETVAHHQVAHTCFEDVATIVVGHSFAPTDDASAFGTRVPADEKIDESYPTAVKAPFD